MVRLTDSETSLTAGVQNHTQFVHVERERERGVAHSTAMVQSVAQPLKTHIPLMGGRNSSFGGCGCTEANQNGTNQALQAIKKPDYRWYLGGLLDVAMQTESARRRAETHSFNPDPKVADYKNAEEIMKIFMGDF